MINIVAVTNQGTEYLHDKHRAVIVPKTGADIICQSLNSARYKLEFKSEYWNVYTVAKYWKDYIPYKATRRNGKIYIKGA